MLTTKNILENYIKFFEEKGHKKIPNVSLVPDNDPSLLFVNSGMFPLVPYLSGEKHPLGTRLVNVQRALRIMDIDEIGDKSHTLGFHMIGNWSLGDYFKDEQLPWIYEFLIEKLGLDIKRVAATVFVGDAVAPKDIPSILLLQKIFKKYGIEGIEEKNIFAYGKDDNWWQRGDAIGELGGPDSEIHYYLGEGDYASQGKNPVNNDDEFLEIGNSVFMQYIKTATGWTELKQKNVDFGGGLERLAWVVQGKKDIFETDNFWSIIEKIQKLSGKDYYASEQNKKAMRILADHMRACVFLGMDGVKPSNKDQGYILRRLIRRMTRAGRSLGIERDLSVRLVSVVVDQFMWLYPVLGDKKQYLESMFKEEEDRFVKTLAEGQRQIQSILKKNTGKDAVDWPTIAFDLYQSVGFPQEIFLEELRDKNISLDEQEFNTIFDTLLSTHQSNSRSGAEGKFKGGLADHSEVVVKYHTITHLLQAGLKKFLGDSVSQAGSNITKDRARFDFFYNEKLTDEQIINVESFINEKVLKHIPVHYEIMEKEEAITKSVAYMKNETYPDQVKVYYIGNTFDTAFSKEFCGGPHVENTGDLSPIQIFKQENIGNGKRRIYLKFI